MTSDYHSGQLCCKQFSHIVHPLKGRTLLYLTTSELCQLYLNKAGGQQVNYGEAPEPSHPSAEQSLESVCFKGNENREELQALLPYAHNLNSPPSDTVGGNWRWPKVKVKRPELQSWPFGPATSSKAPPPWTTEPPINSARQLKQAPSKALWYMLHHQN